MSFKKIFLITLITILLSGCTNMKDSNTSPSIFPSVSPSLLPIEENNFPEDYSFLENVRKEKKDDYINLNNEYIGKDIDYLLKDVDSGKEISTSSFQGIKIIELYSPYCGLCTDEASYISKLFSKNENISYFLTSKERNSKGIQIMRDNGYELTIYAFAEDVPALVDKLYKLGIPGYIVIDENNKIMFLTAGAISNIDTIFSPISDKIEKIEREEDTENDREFCSVCQW